MTREQYRAAGWGLFWSGGLAVAIFVGSRNLRNIDAALVGYTFACLFATFAIAYRYSIWLQRPPTKMYMRRGWEAFLRPGHLWANVKNLGGRVWRLFALNEHILKRSKSRGIAHLLIMWGCVLASAITFPLVFGWVNFETVPGDFSQYRTFAFGFPVFDFVHDSLVGHLIFHGLVWSALLVIPGVMLAFQRRVRDHGAAALQDFQEDFLPLFLLFAVSVTGLLLTVSYTWIKGYGYEFLAILHAVTVIFTLLWLPFTSFSGRRNSGSNSTATPVRKRHPLSAPGATSPTPPPATSRI
ncbi:MAG: MFS transporter [Planctomycetota bacterium]